MLGGCEQGRVRMCDELGFVRPGQVAGKGSFPMGFLLIRREAASDRTGGRHGARTGAGPACGAGVDVCRAIWG